MTLSIYDPEQGCQVLDPKQFDKPEVINAFHPDYVKTYMPEFLSALRLEAKQKENGVINGGKSKATRESKRGKTVNTINVFPKTKAKKVEFTLDVREFHIYSKAGSKK